jgi:hypothetical protein
MAAVVSAAMFKSNPSAAPRLALAELELARVELACRFDGCATDCRVRASVLASVESVRRPRHTVAGAPVNEFIRELLP